VCVCVYVYIYEHIHMYTRETHTDSVAYLNGGAWAGFSVCC
jgi:hypothetical protein